MNSTCLRVLQAVLLLLGLAGRSQAGLAQQDAGHYSGGLKQLLQLAEANYPLLKAKQLDVQAARKGVVAAHHSLLPSLDASYQADYATYNNITGMAYPALLVPISGPPASTNRYDPVFGSAASLLASWQPVTFGQRQAQVNLAKSGLRFAGADERNERFQLQVRVIAAYLDAITATELVRVQLNNLVRTQTNLEAVQTLVASGIRPGVDTALFHAELSRANMELQASRQQQDQTRILLAQLLATDSSWLVSDSFFFSRLPQASYGNAGGDSTVHPLLGLYDAQAGTVAARRLALARTARPTLGVWSTAYARGSGVAYNGTVKAAEGLAWQRYNYGIGLQFSVPLLQPLRIRPQLQQQELLLQSARERREEIAWQLRKQQESADSAVVHSLAAARESPQLLASARFSYKALQSRYQAGLATYAEFIQGQYVLVKAETDDRLAYLAVWKAWLYKTSMAGNLDLFLNQLN